MKNFLFLLLLTILGSLFMLVSAARPFVRENYITQETLDMSRPLDVTIDVALLKTLGPAYEQ